MKVVHPKNQISLAVTYDILGRFLDKFPVSVMNDNMVAVPEMDRFN